MANYNDLKTGINAVIKTNGRQEISGAALNTALNNMITELGAGFQYMGVATPATNPGTPDANVFYLASEAGTYTNFRGIVINEGEVCALVWNGTWAKQVTGAATADKLNQLGQELGYYKRETTLPNTIVTNRVIFQNISIPGNGAYIKIDGDSDGRILIYANNDIESLRIADNVVSGVIYPINLNVEINTISLYTNLSTESHIKVTLYDSFVAWAYQSTALSGEIDELFTLVTKKTFINVTPSDNLRTILESITDASPNNRYIIRLASGTYDISTLYNAEEKAVTNFAGLFVPDYVKLLGVGDRENVILIWEENDFKPRLSTINLYLYSELENLTVKSKKLRYACHDDWVKSGFVYETAPKYERTIKNCHFIGVENYMGVSYGSGYKSGCWWKFDHCIFESGLYMHNNNGFVQSAQVTFINCRFKDRPVHLASLNRNSVVVNDIYFIGCQADRINVDEDNAELYGAGIKTRVSGFANTFGNTDVYITNTDGVDYSSWIDLIQ